MAYAARHEVTSAAINLTQSLAYNLDYTYNYILNTVFTHLAQAIYNGGGFFLCEDACLSQGFGICLAALQDVKAC
jgi:hypothetical protein